MVKVRATTQVQKVNIKAGQKAPFNGVLLSRPAIAKIISNYEAQIKNLKAKNKKITTDFQIKLKATQQLHELRLSIHTKLLDANRVTYQKSISLYEKSLKNARKPNLWYESQGFNLFLGCAVCGGVCIGTNVALKN